MPKCLACSRDAQPGDYLCVYHRAVSDFVGDTTFAVPPVVFTDTDDYFDTPVFGADYARARAGMRQSKDDPLMWVLDIDEES
jgi:hypothetical protein